jgi:hypothetical protein
MMPGILQSHSRLHQSFLCPAAAMFCIRARRVGQDFNPDCRNNRNSEGSILDIVCRFNEHFALVRFMSGEQILSSLSDAYRESGIC